MNKLTCFLITAIAAFILLSCEPAKKGGGDFAPSSTNDGTIQTAPDTENEMSEKEELDSLELNTDKK